MPFKASQRLAAPLILATASLSLLALHCSSDTGGQTAGTSGTFTTSGGGGTTAQGGGTTAGMTSGGVTTAGSASGGMSGAGTTTGGTLTAGGGGSGGAAGGAGGAAGGTGGGTGGSGGGGGGGNSTTFAAVKDLMGKSCGTGKCHNADSGELNYQDVANLYKTLTTPVPDTTKHCAGNPAVIKANDTNSLLLKAIAAQGAMCMNKGAQQTIGRMPDNCPADRACLTADQIKVFTDWVAAGAPM